MLFRRNNDKDKDAARAASAPDADEIATTADAPAPDATTADAPAPAQPPEGRSGFWSRLRSPFARHAYGPDMPAPEVPQDAEANERLVRREFWPKVRATAGKVPFVKDTVAAYYCVADPETPTSTKAILLGALAYFVMPIDVIPDFIAGVGFTDDAAAMLAAFKAVSGSIKDKHYKKAADALAGDVPEDVDPPPGADGGTGPESKGGDQDTAPGGAADAAGTEAETPPGPPAP